MDLDAWIYFLALLFVVRTARKFIGRCLLSGKPFMTLSGLVLQEDLVFADS
jgi:hypothetical protein